MLLELGQHLVLHIHGQVLEIGDRLRDLLDLEVGEEFHDVGGALLAQGDHHDSNLLPGGDLGLEFLPVLFFSGYEVHIITHPILLSASAPARGDELFHQRGKIFPPTWRPDPGCNAYPVENTAVAVFFHMCREARLDSCIPPCNRGTSRDPAPPCHPSRAGLIFLTPY
jgi:hypothetical protein